MPKVNTFNYDTIASWNGAQDLFVVEQPDGTKVATPAMVKQFIEAGDFEATGEVKDGHGNVLADMAKSDDVDNAINTALDNSKISILYQRFPNVNIDRAWGSLYLSDVLSFDTSSLDLQSAPKMVSLTVMSRTATVLTIIDAVNTGNIKFYISRPSAASNVTVEISALIVY